MSVEKRIMVTDINKQTLLLVEDSEDDAFLFEWTFREAGTSFCIQHARNGSEAIEFLRNATSPAGLPVIILLDLKMPVLNGFDVLSWMQQQTFARKVPVIVVSGSAQEEDRVRARELGACDYFVKPVTLADLPRILAHIAPDAKGAKFAETGARA